MRSYNTSHINGSGTKPEIVVRKYLFSHGYCYRVNDKRYPGKPDIVLPKYKTCFFVNGCFWHAHAGRKYIYWPKSNEIFWRKKLISNVERDNRNYQILKELGWNVITIWECELKKPKLEKALERLEKELRNNLPKD